MRSALGGLILACGALAAAAQTVRIDVIPRPQSVMAGTGGVVRLRQGTPVVVPTGDAGALKAARWLAKLTRRSRGLELAPGAAPRRGTVSIVFEREPGPASSEAYKIDIGRGRVAVEASSDAGMLYGAVTLWQLITAEEGRGPVRLPSLAIADQPRFAWRGLLLDSARHMQSPAFILKTIDWMALHKLNVLQWHLTDDQGWRLPVPGYPRLTEVGAWRVPASLDLPGADRPALYGGFYTEAEIRQIVAHAKARGVTVVPEIEMPGHALAALLAYPELSAGPLPPKSMQSDWGLIPDAFGVDEPVFAFLDKVLARVTDLFPSRFIDIGGDEVPLDLWRASPAVQARMKALGVPDEAALQNYFIRRVDTFLAARGRRLIGWEEILHGGPLPSDAAISSWQGAASAVAATEAGHDVVLAIAPTLYFDNRQSALANEPPGRGWVVSLRDVYALDPASPPLPPAPKPVAGAPPPPPPLAFTDADRAHILGVQGNLWTEHVRTDARAEKMIWPRAAAVAEAGWTSQANRDWPDFLQRLPAEFTRFEGLGLDEDRSALALDLQATPSGAEGASITLANQSAYGRIRYTLNGAPPAADSTAYAGPLTLALPARVRAAAFVGGAKVSTDLDERLDAQSVRTRVSQQLTLCPGTLPLNLEGQPTADGRRPVFLTEIMNPCWIWAAVDTSDLTRVKLTLAAAPFNLQLGPQLAQVIHRPATSAKGEIQVRLDTCDGGELLAILPLPAARPEIELDAAVPARPGVHALCFVYANGARLDPIWGVEKVELVARQAGDHD
jgi:hexosaminidase